MNTILFFTADWCHYCKKMKPVMGELVREGYTVRVVDVDKEPELKRQYGVRSLPTSVVVVNNAEVKRFIGVTSKEEIKKYARK